MNRTERDSFTASTDQTDLAYGESACLETPPDFFQALDSVFHFDVDLTAHAGNHLLPMWFGPGSPAANGEDALTCTWHFVPTVYQQQHEHFAPTTCGFSNPPYGAFIPKILLKAVEESRNGFTSVFLLPMRASSWYTEIVLTWADFLWHLDPRLTFWYKGEPKPTARVKAPRGTHPSQIVDGYLCDAFGTPVLKAANALFDSIVVGFRPTLGLPKVPYTVQPKLWRWKTERPPL